MKCASIPGFEIALFHGEDKDGLAIRSRDPDECCFVFEQSNPGVIRSVFGESRAMNNGKAQRRIRGYWVDRLRVVVLLLNNGIQG